MINKDTVLKVLTRERQKYDNGKNIVTYANHRNILVLTQPAASSCIHIIDGAHPEYSTGDLGSVRVIGSFSEIEHILVDETPHTPPEVIIGSEPAHGRCYFYQKADLERQKGDWGAVVQIEEQAAAQNLTPADPIEWMPFLHAHAQVGNIDRLTELAPIIRTDPFIASQACEILVHTPGLSVGTIETIKSLYWSK